MNTIKKYKNKYRSDTIRLKNHDYGSDDWYFVTICTKNRDRYFGEIIRGENIPPGTQHFATLLQPTNIGKIANQYWTEIPNHFPFVILDEFVIMPDHVHGLIYFNKPDHRYRIQQPNQFGPQSQNLASVIRGFKAAVKKYATINNIPFQWQSRYHEHVVRNQVSLHRIRKYIQNNTDKWAVH
jgi:putative transposase